MAKKVKKKIAKKKANRKKVSKKKEAKYSPSKKSNENEYLTGPRIIDLSDTLRVEIAVTLWKGRKYLKASKQFWSTDDEEWRYTRGGFSHRIEDAGPILDALNEVYDEFEEKED